LAQTTGWEGRSKPDAKVTANGSEPVIPGSQGGVEYATANDNKTAYFAVENMDPVKAAIQSKINIYPQLQHELE
jgi:hypothetical protein